MTRPILMRGAQVLAAAAMVLSSRAQLPVSVDISLVQDTLPGTLDVRVRPNGASFNGVVGLIFSIRWPQNSSAIIGSATADCPGALALQPGIPALNGGFRYLTFSSAGAVPMSNAGCSWPADVWTRIGTLPVTGDVDCTTLRIADDAFADQTNRGFFCALNGLPATGAVLYDGVNLCHPASVDIQLSPSNVPGNLDVRFRANGNSFSGVLSTLFTLRWSASSNAGLGPDIPACAGYSGSGAGSLTSNGGYWYDTRGAVGDQPLGASGCSMVGGVWTTMTRIPVSCAGADMGLQLINDAFTHPNNRDYFCSLDGLQVQGRIIGGPVVPELNDADDDGVPDECDSCPTTPGSVGTACDDGDACTMNDVLDGSCQCAGSYQDSDGDGICDGLDGCPTDALKTAPGQCGCGNLEPGNICDDNNSSTVNDLINASCQCEGSPVLALTMRAFLQGPYIQSGSRMTDVLRQAGLVPLTEPYTAMGYAHVGGGGGETTTPAVLSNNDPNTAKVDWVLVELRSAADPSHVLFSKACLIQRDGLVVESLPPHTGPRFNAPPGSYYVALRHRNHLGVMSAAPLVLSTSSTNVNFHQQTTPVWGTNARRSIGPIVALWCGDVNFDGRIKYTGSGNDRDPILLTVGSSTPNNTIFSTYNGKDVDMNGQVNYTGSDNDRDPVLLNVGSTTPNTIRDQQIP